MAWREATYQLTSDATLIMHNGQTADPLNQFAKAMKNISGKRKKTDADYEEMAHIEFMASLYINGNGPVLPARMIDAVLLAAAKKNREGPLAKSGVFCKQDAILEYDGPRKVEEMWKDGKFRRVDAVRVQQARVMRTRAQFPEWGAKVCVSYEETLVNIQQLDAWFDIAGTQIGLGDWRPQHGRFSAVRLPE